ncbi:alpha/beta hydrolase [Nocardioides sp. HDW12B]|uniref:alpha/beta hydrolase n=1 Tax=Nocardioides sp. HDW12B TaxID=2714939 RepID=UPI0014087E75|nr:alpha/beta hydrolase [Nocardioides sp. HDW12B]QIK66218.1 alpha/beta hydrolase [Nocardioides sp. HDW12B]
MSYLSRQLVTSALAANAIKPVPGAAASVPAMFAGWLVSELAPHVIAGTLVDTVLEVRRTRGRSAAPLLGLLNSLALAHVTQQGRRSQAAFERGLDEGLGGDHLDRLRQEYDDLDWRTPLRQLVWPFRLPVPGVEVVKDLTYAPGHGRRGRLDVYRPEGGTEGGAQGRPVLLQVHGGAWTIGEKDHQGLPLMKHMASRGWVCVAPNYRLSPRVAFPEHLVDVKRAIAWIRENIAEHGGDPSFVAITGGSAGGHLAALAALTPNDPEYQPGFEDVDTTLQAAVPFYGVYDFAGVTGSKAALRMRDRFLARRVLFSDPEEDLEPFEKGSPLLRVGPHAPPFYVIHGANDTLVEVAQARAFVAALREATDQPVAYTELAGTQHAFDVFPSVRSQHSVRSAERFLRWAWASRTGEQTHAAADWERSDPIDDTAREGSGR